MSRLYYIMVCVLLRYMLLRKSWQASVLMVKLGLIDLVMRGRKGGQGMMSGEKDE